ncbi:nucleotidyltransferase family protein [Phaeobacter sp. CAU 1743]|uniref:nucleotidyltransferase family protein n=1 Tax=Phaeobacter sp. CAU 1743 TaxID=3140367 RepID=UPI0023B54D11
MAALSPEAVMIYAAGFGTRMKALTRDLPKPMIPVAGRPLIDHTLDLARAMLPARIVVNTHYKAEILQEHLKPQGVLISDEQPEILDTGGGLRHALPLLGDGPVYTSNSDAIWAGPNPFEMLRAAWDPAQMDGLMLCVPLTRAVGRKGGGDFSADAAGRISWGGDLVWGGVQILKTDGLQSINEAAFSTRLLWNPMIEEKRLYALEYPGHWCDVGHPEGITLAEQLLTHDDV